MIRQLFWFEWNYHTRKLLFLAMLLGFMFFGFAFTAFGMTMPYVHINSPYMLAYSTCIISLGAIFSASVLVTNAHLRDVDYKVEELVYVTPITKWQFLFSRFIGTYIVAIVAVSMATTGMLLGSIMPWQTSSRIGEFSIFNFLNPFLMLSLPNVFTCLAIVFGIATLFKNQVAVYVGGMLTFILYIAGSVFAGAPWVANVSPSSEEAMLMAAVLDPFGMAAFFQQVGHYTIEQKNNEALHFTGSLVTNRVFWFVLSTVLLGIAYRFFSFRKVNTREKKKSEKEENPSTITKYTTKRANPSTYQAKWIALWSMAKVEVIAMVQSIPFLIILLYWLFLMGTEVLSAIDGGIRTSPRYPDTSIIFSNIMELLPILGLVIMVFYSNEQVWRVRLLKQDEWIDSSPISNTTLFLSKYVALALLPILLVSISILFGVVVQISSGYYQFEFDLYLSMFYYAGYPMLLISVLGLAIQSIIPNRYIGMMTAGLVILAFCTDAGKYIGIRHVLVRFAAPLLRTEVSDMNGLGAYAEAFHWQMLYWTAVTILIAWFSFSMWQRGKEQNLVSQFTRLKSNLTVRWISILIGATVTMLVSGGYIFHTVNIKEKYLTKEEKLDWQQAYEEKYRKFDDLSQPEVIAIKTNIDLYPSKQMYEVHAHYQIQNQTDDPIDSLLVHTSKEIQLDSISLAKQAEITVDLEFGYRWVVLKEAIEPGEVVDFEARFSSSWNGFTKHDPFNSIISNGTFIRISNYFPHFGYSSEYEISRVDEREERGLPAQDSVRKLISPKLYALDKELNTYHNLKYEAVISTEEDQIAITSGNLIKEWKREGRSYYHYKNDHSIPFRFAVSSARYQVEKMNHKGVEVELYYHPEHAYNIEHMKKSMKETYDYCTSQFGAYQYNVLRYVEISGFSRRFAATAYPNTLYAVEDFGFVSDLSDTTEPDLLYQLIAHEWSHQWWGGQIDPKSMEGGDMLIETFAQYTELMLYKRKYGREKAIQALNTELELYLDGRGYEKETPLYRVDRTPVVTYSKGQIVMHAIQELIGENQLNQVLKYLIEEHAYPNTPPTSLDFLNKLYQVAPEKYHPIFDDWLKRIITYDVSIDDHSFDELGNGKYKVKVKVDFQKFEGNGWGKKSKKKIDDILQVGVSTTSGIKIENYRLASSDTTLQMIVDEIPRSIELDPNLMLIEENRKDNLKRIEM